MLCASCAAAATSTNDICGPGEPLTVKTPALNSRSSGFASNVCAAIRLAFSITLSHALTIADPPTTRDREP